MTMRFSLPFLTLLLGLLIGAAGFAWLDTGRIATPGEDPRLAIRLTPDERAHVRGEMLEFLNGVAVISDAAVAGDREAIAETADALKRGDGGGETIRQKVPEGFRLMSRDLRQGFAGISEMAATADMENIQRATAETLHRCAACHGSYRVIPQSRRPAGLATPPDG